MPGKQPRGLYEIRSNSYVPRFTPFDGMESRILAAGRRSTREKPEGQTDCKRMLKNAAGASRAKRISMKLTATVIDGWPLGLPIHRAKDVSLDGGPADSSFMDRRGWWKTKRERNTGSTNPAPSWAKAQRRSRICRVSRAQLPVSDRSRGHGRSRPHSNAEEASRRRCRRFPVRPRQSGCESTGACRAGES